MNAHDRRELAERLDSIADETNAWGERLAAEGGPRDLLRELDAATSSARYAARMAETWARTGRLGRLPGGDGPRALREMFRI